MDSERFDTITRTLASGLSRRGVVRKLTGVALGGILVAVGVGEAGAKKKHSQVRAQKGPCPRPNSRCPKGKNAICTDTQTDSDNCGGCGTVCTGGKTCVGGQCVAVATSCPAYKTLKAGQCVFPCASNPCAACNTGDIYCVGNADGTHVCVTNMGSTGTFDCTINGCPADMTCHSRADGTYACDQILSIGNQC